MLHEDDINWTFKCSWNLRTQHLTTYRDDEKGLQCDAITNKTNNGYGVGKSKKYFFIDKDEREFLTISDLVDAYNEKFKFSNENPNHEIKWVRIIINKNKDENE